MIYYESKYIDGIRHDRTHPEGKFRPIKLNRSTEGLSELGKHIIESCPNAYVLNGQVFDPCHVWMSGSNPTTPKE